MSPKILDSGLRARAVELLLAGNPAAVVATQLKAEFPGESVSDVTVGKWAKAEGIELQPGRRLGDYSSTKRDKARELVAEGEHSKVAIARMLKISRARLYKLLAD